jgi:hypothetical protein
VICRLIFDPQRFLASLTGSLFAARVYETYGELILEEKYQPPGFTMPLGLKDIRAVLAAAEAKSVPMPVASLERDHFITGIAWGKATRSTRSIPIAGTLLQRFARSSTWPSTAWPTNGAGATRLITDKADRRGGIVIVAKVVSRWASKAGRRIRRDHVIQNAAIFRGFLRQRGKRCRNQ